MFKGLKRQRSGLAVVLFHVLAVVANLIQTSTVRAADTVETFDTGALDVEMYVGFDGIGLEKYEKTIGSEFVVGYGLVDRFSTNMILAVESNEYFADTVTGLSFSCFGTPISLKYFELDLMLDIASSDNFSQMEVIPAFELNLNLHEDMSSVGVYLRAGMPIYGRQAEPELPVEGDPMDPLNADAPEEPEPTVVYQVDTAMGVYWTVVENHQLLMEYDVSFMPKAADDEKSVEIGGVALGYNVVLSDRLELINQVSVDIPGNEENVSFGVSTGFLATMP